MTIEQFIMRVHAISKIGLKYSSDPYALENYQELMELSTEMINQVVEQPLETDFYERDLYPTPSISVRVLLLNEKGKFLMVKEAADGKYSLPGGWCDVFDSPKQTAIEECLQETGYNVEIQSLLGVFFRDKYKPKMHSLISEYVIYFYGKIIDGDNNFSHEVTETTYFSLEDLPELSIKNSEIEIRRALNSLTTGISDFD